MKAAKECSEEHLKKLSEAVLRQINERQYGTDLQTKEVSSILKFGIAFSGKHVQITAELS